MHPRRTIDSVIRGCIAGDRSRLCRGVAHHRRLVGGKRAPQLHGGGPCESPTLPFRWVAPWASLRPGHCLRSPGGSRSEAGKVGLEKGCWPIPLPPPMGSRGGVGPDPGWKGDKKQKGPRTKGGGDNGGGDTLHFMKFCWPKGPRMSKKIAKKVWSRKTSANTWILSNQKNSQQKIRKKTFKKCKNKNKKNTNFVKPKSAKTGPNSDDHSAPKRD